MFLIRYLKSGIAECCARCPSGTRDKLTRQILISAARSLKFVMQLALVTFDYFIVLWTNSLPSIVLAHTRPALVFCGGLLDAGRYNCFAPL